MSKPKPEAGAGWGPASGRKALIGHLHRINYVDHAIRLIDVRNRNRRCSTLLVGENELVALHHRGQSAALYSGQRCFAAARLDLLIDVLGGEPTGHYVVGEDLLQLSQIFRL